MNSNRTLMHQERIEQLLKEITERAVEVRSLMRKTEEHFVSCELDYPHQYDFTGDDPWLWLTAENPGTYSSLAQDFQAFVAAVEVAGHMRYDAEGRKVYPDEYDFDRFGKAVRAL